MTLNSGYRRKVEKLLAGDRNYAYLMDLLLFCRDKCDGRRTLQEIGDLVAHSDERNKGVLAERVSYFADSMDFLADMNYGLASERLQFDNLSNNTYIFLKKNLTKLLREKLPKESIFDKKDMKEFRENFSRNFTKNSNGSWRFCSFSDDKKTAILSYLCKHILFEKQMNSSDLIKQFADTLKSHSFLKRSEVSEFRKLESLVGAFCIARMHQCIITRNNQSSYVIKACINNDELMSMIFVSNEFWNSRNIDMGLILFRVSGLASDICHESLLSLKDLNNKSLEIDPSGKLAPL